MKRILSSTIQVFKQINSDPMMFAACFTPFVMGALIKFGIPFLERITDFSLQAYYPIFDLLLSIMAPVLLCFAFAMITLEEIDDKVSRYFSITPLGKSGYLFTRLGVPSIISAVIAFIVLLLFSLEKLSIGMTICLALLGSVQAIIVSLMIITLSSNKLEGIPDSRGILRSLHCLRNLGYLKEIVILVSTATPKEYLNYLEERHYPYIVSGNDHVDYEKAFQILHEQYGCKYMRTDSGGGLTNKLLENGLIDEISLVISPCFVGNKEKQLFDNLLLSEKVNLELQGTENAEHGCLSLRYAVKNKD